MAVAPSATTPLTSQRWPGVIPIACVVDGQWASWRPAWSGPARPSSTPATPGRSTCEGELVIVVGRRSRRLTPATAASAILGFTCGNFPAIGPCVETARGPVEIPVVAGPPPAGARDVAAGLDRPGHRPGHGREP